MSEGSSIELSIPSLDFSSPSNSPPPSTSVEYLHDTRYSELCPCTPQRLSQVLGQPLETDTFITNEEEFPYLSSYQTLSAEPQEIRLLRWIPSPREESIHLSLKVYRLDTCPSYMALSYTWGSNRRMRRMTVDGQRTAIRETLFEFLQSLPFHVKDAPFWTDVLCINQRDISERNNQVACMGNIYHQAAAVYCWLGSSTSDIVNAREYLDQIAEHKNGAVDPQDRDPTENSQTKLKIQEATKGFRSRKKSWCKGLLDLFKRDYWMRVWIIQETVLARHLVFLAGTQLFTFDEFCAIQGDIENPLPVYYLSNSPQTTRNTILSIVIGRSAWTSKEPLKPEHFLKFIRKYGCRDPRDMVFGLYGIFPTLDATRPDYNLTTLEVWWRACVAFQFHFHESQLLWSHIWPSPVVSSAYHVLTLPGNLMYEFTYHDITPLVDEDEKALVMTTISASDTFESQRTGCNRTSIYLTGFGEVERGFDLLLKYFVNFEPRTDDALLVYRWPGGSDSTVGCIILRKSEGANESSVKIVGVGMTGLQYSSGTLGDHQIELDADLASVAEITIHRTEHLVGFLELNGPAAALFHQNVGLCY